ncbi:EB module domain-containing protein [Ditylenchus destructor]|nr:EB module domain-containing protein [Ditylenchus destructor]
MPAADYCPYLFSPIFLPLSLFLLRLSHAANVCPPGMLSLYNGATCTNDQTCQGLATGFFCFQGRCCAQSNPPPSSYGTSCTNENQCLMPNLQCINNVCYCRPGFNYNGLECRPQNLYDPGLGANCQVGQIPFNGGCFNMVGYGGMCDVSRQCNFVGGICQQKRCICPTGQIYDGYRCINDPNIPMTHIVLLQPAPINSPCMPNTEVMVDGRCLQKRPAGDPCVHTLQCQPPPGEPWVGMQCIQSVCTPLTNPLPITFQPPITGGLQVYREPSLPVPCGLNQIRINSQCLPLATAGEPCLYDLQCRSPFPDRGMYCGNFVCKFASGFDWRLNANELGFPTCRNPSSEVELINSIPKDCIYQRCSPGFHCEYNSVYKGQPKMYPGYTNLPLQCTAINSCTFVDYPYCVYSESYRHKVCCSKPQCL